MSKNNNVNPGQYKVAGRERQGEDVVASDHKARLAQAQPAAKPAPTVKSPASRAAKKSTR
jgi:hypothetical protein